MSTYNTGTVTVTNGSPTVTGAGTGWAVALVTGGVFSCNGVAVPIAAVTDDDTLVLDYEWPDATAAGADYSIARESSEVASVVTLVDKLTRATITLALSAVHPNGVGTLAQRNALTLTPEDDGFIWERMETGYTESRYRWDGVNSVWVGPFDFTGPTGAAGSSDVVGTSTTSLAIATGSKSFTVVEANRGWGVGARLRAASAANPANFMEGVVTAYSGFALTVLVDLVGGSGTKTDWTINLAGQRGADPGIPLTWDTGTSDADPGTGKMRANNASLASATFLYISKTSAGGSSIATFLAALDDSTNTVKGQLLIIDPVSKAQAVVNVTTLTDATGYVKVGVTTHSGATSFAAGLPVSFQFMRAGDAGAGAVSSVNGLSGTVVINAGNTANTPAGNVAATTVQAAIDELDSEKAALAGSISQAFSALQIELGHASDTTVSRGAAGFIAVEGKRVPSPASQAQGDILVRGATEWDRLAIGAAHRLLGANSTPNALEYKALTFDGNLDLIGSRDVQVTRGVKFPATQNPSSDANTLDDYEEGTFTPAFSATGATFSYNARSGNYIKIGRKVTIMIRIILNTSGNTLTANPLTVTGLPFADTNNGAWPMCPIGYQSTTTSYVGLYAQGGGGSSTLAIMGNTAAATLNVATANSNGALHATNGTIIDITYTYFASA